CFDNQRVAVVPVEGAAVVAVPGDDGDGHLLTVYLTCQTPHAARRTLSRLFGISADAIRVVVPYVGGSFGAKSLNAEMLVTIKAALTLGRPVKWVESRSEGLIGMPHGRAQRQFVELGLRTDGTITGLR